MSFPDINKTAKAQAERDAEIKLLRLKRCKSLTDDMTLSMLEENLIDFDPQPVYVPEICKRCHHAIAAMVGCYCDWGDGDGPA